MAGLAFHMHQRGADWGFLVKFQERSQTPAKESFLMKPDKLTKTLLYIRDFKKMQLPVNVKILFVECEP